MLDMSDMIMESSDLITSINTCELALECTVALENGGESKNVLKKMIDFVIKLAKKVWSFIKNQFKTIIFVFTDHVKRNEKNPYSFYTTPRTFNDEFDNKFKELNGKYHSQFNDIMEKISNNPITQITILGLRGFDTITEIFILLQTLVDASTKIYDDMYDHKYNDTYDGKDYTSDISELRKLHDTIDLHILELNHQVRSQTVSKFDIRSGKMQEIHNMIYNLRYGIVRMQDDAKNMVGKIKNMLDTLQYDISVGEFQENPTLDLVKTFWSILDWESSMTIKVTKALIELIDLDKQLVLLYTNSLQDYKKLFYGWL